MQLVVETSRGIRNGDSGAMRETAAPELESGIDSELLAGVDVGLFRALRKLGTPKQRVCSALWLSYAEYDELAKIL